MYEYDIFFSYKIKARGSWIRNKKHQGWVWRYVWPRIVKDVRTAIEGHNGYIHIPKLEPIEASVLVRLIGSKYSLLQKLVEESRC